ncbi:hypothetical protein TGVAND_310260 [Toxoplasma gondii VAND]|uniref:Uncharacterized protein n=1 Tax=Toxoplasma gondii VAND TaxID=933077 RepID=A0A086PPX8_TOXGO|nr:hypothetical protein TGVAND_310260 [Toxoplasma gondii VAND]
MFSQVSIVIAMWLNNRVRNFKHNSASTPLPKRPPETRLLSPVDELSQEDEEEEAGLPLDVQPAEIVKRNEEIGRRAQERLAGESKAYAIAMNRRSHRLQESCARYSPGTRRDDVGVNERTGARDSQLKSEETEAAIQTAVDTASVVAAATTTGLSRGPKLNTEISADVDFAAGTAAGKATGVAAGRCKVGKIGNNVNDWPQASATSESEPTVQQETTIGIQQRVTREDPGDSETKRTPLSSASGADGGQVVSLALPQEEFLMRPESSSESVNNLRPTIAVKSPSKRGLGPHEGHERCKGIESETSELSSIKDGPDREETMHRDCETQPRIEPQRREEATAVGNSKADSVLDETDKGLVAPALPEVKSITMMTEKVEGRTERGGSRRGSPAPHLHISCDNTIDVIASPAKQHIESAEGSIREIFHEDATIAKNNRNISGEEWSRTLESKLIDTLYSESLR